MKKTFILMLMTASCFSVANAQLMVDENGRVGVGIETNDTLLSEFTINNRGEEEVSIYVNTNDLTGLKISRTGRMTSIPHYSEKELKKDLYITGNSVTIKDNTLTFAPHRKIVVWRNGVLNIDGATLNNARIVVKPGGKLNITNGAVINPRDDNKPFAISKGGELKISNGTIN